MNESGWKQMGFFDLFGKKKQVAQLELPLPSAPTEEQLTFIPSEIPPIQFEEAPLPEPMTEEPAPLVVEERPMMQIRTEAPVLEDLERVHVATRPLFVAVSDYKAILAGVNSVRSKLMEVDHVIGKLNTIKNEEEQYFERWRTQLEDVEKKLNYVDQIIAKANG